MRASLFLFLLCFYGYFKVNAQALSAIQLKNDVQYGVSFKASVLLHDNKSKGRKNYVPTLRLAMDAGVGVLLNLNAIRCKLLPAYHVELLTYYNGIGSGRISRGNIDIISSLTSTLGTVNKSQETPLEIITTRTSPLYFFSNHAPPPLVNPFNYSISAGMHYIIPTTKYKFSQRVGFIGFKIRDAQFAYSNDGGMGLNKIGDRKDRNYTGCLLLAYGFRQHTLLNMLELTYLKYTGYNKNTFEVLSNLSFGYTDYVDKDQEDFNRSKWSITATGLQQQAQVHIDFNNITRLDLQHLIHKLVYDPYHIVKHAPAIAFGGSFAGRRNYYFR